MIQQLHFRGFRDTDESCEIAMFVPAETLTDISRRRSCRFSDLPVQLEIPGTEKSSAQRPDGASERVCQLPRAEFTKRSKPSQRGWKFKDGTSIGQRQFH
jgi:hypothetical protein